MGKHIFFLIMEVFIDVLDYEGFYQVSNLGNVKSLEREVNHPKGGVLLKKERILKPSTDKNGYKIVVLCKIGVSKTFKIHRLVCSSFIKNLENKPCVNHKNGIKNDNRIENLEWCTVKENTKHSYYFGFQKAPKGEESCRCKLKKEDVLNIRKSSLKNSELSKIYNISASNIYCIRVKKSWKHI